ncbi:MAG: sulfatase-like hydrolase/transferase [Chloroflexi bacterium]|nr:sulfatase-like hydrolase/transferase [Chloroflexota bacterium]
MSKQPNIIIFFTDQQRWDTSALHGNPMGLMPNFDRIAQESTHLAHCFTMQPVCGPARSCMQTGMYASQTGCWRNGIPLPQDATTLAKCFREGGYSTAYIGKWHLASTDPVPEEERGGYEHWLAANVLEFCSEPYSTILYDNDNEPVKLPGYRVDAMTDVAIRYIAEERDQPFFLFLSYLEPHHQNHVDDYPPPDGYREPYTGRWLPPDLQALTGSAPQHWGGYCGMVKRLDEAYGRLLDALKSLDMMDETVVVFTSDHGNHFKTRNDEYKRSCHEAAMRVPGSITGPGFEGGGRIDALVSLLDIPPTVLDAAGLPIPERMEGRSLLPLLRRAEVDWPDDVFTQISESQVGRAVRTKRWKYGVTAPGLDGSQRKDADHYIEQYLYDLQSDPYELNNLVGIESLRVIADEMRERLLNHMSAIGEPPAVIESAAVRASGQRNLTPMPREWRYYSHSRGMNIALRRDLLSLL